MPQNSASSPSSEDLVVVPIIAPHGRRGFLKGCSAALMLGGLTAAGAVTAQAASKASPTLDAVSGAEPVPAPEPVFFSATEPFYRPVEHLTLDHFAPHTGEIFRIHALNSEDGSLVPVELRLTQAKSLPFALSQGGDAGLHSFDLMFEGPTDRPLNQGTFAMEHPKHGSIVMFLVPVGQTPTARQYQAIFNRGPGN